MLENIVRMIAAMLFSAVFLCQPLYAQVAQEIEIELGSIGFDLEVDQVRQRLYVSLPDRNEITIVSLQSFEVLENIIVGSSPHGIDLSDDGTTLYVALNGASSVAYVNLESLEVTTVEIGAELGNALTYDVVEGRPDQIFVSASPGSGGFAWIAMIQRDQGNATSRVASERIIRASPTFAVDPNKEFLFIGEGFSPNSLYKLDITQDTAPIILEDDHGSVSGTNNLNLSPDSSRIYLGSGQVLRTESFVQVGQIGSGPSKVSADGTLAYVAAKSFFDAEPITIEVYETDTFTLVEEINASSCVFSASGQQKLELLPGGAGWLVLGDDVVCVITSVPPKILTISPPTGTYLTSQNFDLMLITDTPNTQALGIVNGSVNGIDIAPLTRGCRKRDFLPDGQQVFKCRRFGRKFMRMFGAGVHNIEIDISLDDGSILNSSATWEVLLD